MSAPYFLVASIFDIGAVLGIKIVDFMLFFCAASATPCAWFPAEHAIIPFDFCSFESRDTFVYAPRILKEPVTCRFSDLR